MQPEIPDNNLEGKTVDDLWPIFAREQIALSRELSDAVKAIEKLSNEYSTKRLIAYCMTGLLAFLLLIFMVPSFTVQIGENFKLSRPSICEKEKAN